MQKNYLFRVMAVVMIFLFSGKLAFSQKKAKVLNNTYHSLAGGNFAQDWTNTLLITANDDWSSVPSIQGFRGDDITTATGTDPQTLLADNTPGVIDVNANQANPNTFTTGGPTEFSITNPVVALAGSGTADAPYLMLYLNSIGRQNIQFSCLLRDIDGSVDNSIQPIAFQYRIGETGSFTNIPSAFVADASSGPNLATLETSVSFTLPIDANNSGQVQIRIMTTNAVGNDEFIGIDDILVSSTAIPTGPTLSINDASIPEGNSGSINAEFTVSLSVAAATDVTFTYATANSTAIEPGDYTSTTGTGTITAGDLSTTILVPVIGDTDSESDETFEVNLTNPTVATIADGQGIGTITNDDAVPITLSINDVTISEGNSGTSTASFTVSLSAPAPAGGVTFDIATASGTAVDGSDFVGKTLTSQSIGEGLDSYTFTVDINGDTGFEPNETFFVDLTNVTGATVSDGQGLGTITNDDVVPPTLISTIQGSGLTSSLVGSTQTIQGIVTRVFTGAGSLNGIYVQEEDADNDADLATSEGIFVFNPPTVPAVGALVSITGTVFEFGATNKLTEISPTTSVTIVSTGNPLPTVTNVTLPIANVTDWERYEGMLINVKAATGDLLVTENFELGRYGQVVLAAMDASNQPDTDARIDQYTQFNAPSAAGYSAYLATVAKRTIYLDDAKTAQNTDPLLFGRGGMPLSASNTLRTGDAINSVTAVLDHSADGYKLQTAEPVNFTPVNSRPAANPSVGAAATLKVGNMNVLNYFNGFIAANCANGDCRGADNSTEFTRQRDKIFQAIINTDVDVMSLNEIENDGYDAASSIQNLIDGLNTIQGANTWAFITPSATLSTDAITVGIIYKPAKALPKGAAKVLFTGTFAEIGRGALIQTFEQVSNKAEFTAVSVHFKSKGSVGTGGDNSNGDGSGNNNLQRTRQSTELKNWLEDPMNGLTDPDIIILGDLNSYSKEDPITTLESAGYATLIPISQYSYQFDGNFGALDHALGSVSLASQVTGAIKYNINADEPVILDYNTEFKSAGQIISFYNGDMYRSSDHDPVVVGLNLLCEKPTAVITSNPTSGTACEGETITLAGSGGTEFSWNGGAFTNVPTFDVTATGESIITLIIKDAVGCESLEVEKTVTITPKPAEIVTTETICSGATYTWAVDGNIYSTNTTVTVINDGCTADQKLILTVTPKPTEIVTTETICSGTTYTWAVDGNVYSTNTTVTVVNDGCTADQKLILTVTPKPTEIVTTETICSGTTYTWAVDGNVYSTNTTVIVVNDGCTADQKLILIVTPKPDEIVTTETICSGTTYTWAVDGNIYSTNTTVTVINDGCTANQKLVLTVNPITYATNTTTTQTPLNGETSFVDANCFLIAKVEPAVTLGASGFYYAQVWVESAPLAAPYVARHYEIGPVGTDGQSGEATVTLYFTQAEFDAYNLATVSTTTTDDLPTGPTDTQGIGRLRIMKYSGSGDDTGSPESYGTSPETIIPSSVIYEGGMWKVTFNVTSFSGFFVNGQTVALPVTLISFTGKKQNNANLLEWKTANEKAFDGFEVQRSENGKGFEKIGFVKGKNVENYQFVDSPLTTQNSPLFYYRLKMIDLDGSSALSKIIAIQSENESNALVGTVYPNPAVDKTAFVEITTDRAETWKITTYNAQGSLQTTSEIQLSKGLNKVTVELNNLSQGIYFLNLENANGEKFVRKVLKN
jgi:uncharacterized protein